MRDLFIDLAFFKQKCALLGGIVLREVILQLNGITKQYPGVLALNDVSISFEKGEVHALLGENGAGKSTLIKVLAGAIEPNGGKIIINDKEFEHMTPSIAQENGIGVIYQEFNLVSSLSIADNIFLGSEIRNGVIRNKKAMLKKSNELLKSLGIDIDPATLVKDLAVAYQQIVEIVKAVSKDVKVLIMDEPSAPLTNNEVEAMFKLIDILKKKGTTIIYISHRIEELFAISDRVSVLRDGEYIDTKVTSETKRDELIGLMVGRFATEQFPERDSEIGKKVLEVKNLYADNYLRDISFDLHKGEILGFAGLVGAGRTELARAIFGADKKQYGEVIIDGKSVDIKSPRHAKKLGVALLPEDRKKQGVLLKMSVGDNITLASIKRLLSRGVIDKKKEASEVSEYIKKLRIKTPTSKQLVKNLSGGNQQKVALAKWLSANSNILIFDEPTRGIDVGAKHEIYLLMNELVKNGNAIIMISSELPEIIGMSDRIIVMSEGMLVGEISTHEATQDKIMDMASGGYEKEVN